MSAIVELESLVDSCIKIFMGKIDKHIDDRAPLNMARWFQWYAFDVIGELTFSKRFGFLEKEADIEGAMRQIDLLLYYISTIGQAFEYHWLLMGNPIVAYLTKNAAGGVIKKVSFEYCPRQITPESHPDC